MRCPACANKFEPTGTRDRFCSDACKMRAHRAKEKRCALADALSNPKCACTVCQDERMSLAAMDDEHARQVAAGERWNICPVHGSDCINCAACRKDVPASERTQKPHRMFLTPENG